MQTLVTTLKPSVTPSWHAQRGLNRVRSGTKGGRAQEAGQRKGKVAAQASEGGWALAPQATFYANS